MEYVRTARIPSVLRVMIMDVLEIYRRESNRLSSIEPKIGLTLEPSERLGCIRRSFGWC